MTMLITPVGQVTFSQLEEPRSFKDMTHDENGKPMIKKYSISVEFSGEDATKLRMQLMEMGKAVRMVDGKLKVSFNRTEASGKPRLVGEDKKDLTNRPKFLPKGTKVKVAFAAREFPMGVALMLDGVMIIGEIPTGAAGPKTVTLDSSAIVDKEFLDVF